MTKKEQRINRLFLYAGILTLLYYLGQGITVGFGQSLLYLWLMLSLVCFGRFSGNGHGSTGRVRPSPVPGSAR